MATRYYFLIERNVVEELKVIEQITPVHEAHMLTYLRLSGCKAGLLINFDVKLLKDGICRYLTG